MKWKVITAKKRAEGDPPEKDAKAMKKEPGMKHMTQNQIEV